MFIDFPVQHKPSVLFRLVIIIRSIKCGDGGNPHNDPCIVAILKLICGSHVDVSIPIIKLLLRFRFSRTNSHKPHLHFCLIRLSNSGRQPVTVSNLHTHSGLCENIKKIYHFVGVAIMCIYDKLQHCST